MSARRLLGRAFRRAFHRTLICALCWAVGSAPAHAQTPLTIRFAAEEWPPFVSDGLPDDGLSGALLRAVLDRLGYTARIDYFPWKRAMELGLHDSRYAGFLAVWRTPEREKLCHFSTPVGDTRIVLAYLKDKPVRATQLAELRGVRIGTVSGFSNGEAFDTLVRQGGLSVEEGVNDETNLRKLLARRYPAVLVERRVLRHLLTTRFKTEDRERIAVNERLFAGRTVHICFKRTQAGLVQQRAFNDAAKGVDFGAVEREYWKRIGEVGVAGD
ncbi:transporter substrate-binding domain-containing protein [Massilia sp. METH4]|uniref:substrate-binding periplasmic protein n=1 Tax=Massilia sp. METH4 TaxID=3123041 RepID=UPI0030CCD008